MNKQVKLVTAAGILGLFLIGNYAFEFLSKIGAGVLSAVLTGQLPAEAWNSELYTAIWQQSVPFLLMIIIGAALTVWSSGKDKVLAESEADWAATAADRKVGNLAVVGGLLAFSGFYALFVPLYFGYKDLFAALSSPDSVDYVLKAVLPNYAVLLMQIALGVWLAVGVKAAAPAMEAAAPAEQIGAATDTTETETADGDAEESAEADGSEAVAVAEEPVVAEEVNKVL